MHWLLLEFERFLHMGGYAWYVWPAYLVAFLVLALNLYFPLRERKKFFKKICEYQKSLQDNYAPHT